MIEYHDNKFSEIMPIGKAIKRLQMEMDSQPEPIKALHVGTPAALQKIAQEGDLEKRIASLEEKIEAMKPLTSESIILPSPAMIASVLQDNGQRKVVG
jgi:hypothetical protein